MFVGVSVWKVGFTGCVAGVMYLLVPYGLGKVDLGFQVLQPLLRFPVVVRGSCGGDFFFGGEVVELE